MLRSEEDGEKDEVKIIGNDESTSSFQAFRAECFGDRGLVGGGGTQKRDSLLS